MKTLKSLAIVAIKFYMHKHGHDMAHETGYYQPEVDIHEIYHAAKCIWHSIVG